MFLSFKKDKKLILESLKIMASIIFAQIIITLVGFLDVFMIGKYGEGQIHFSAVGIGAEIWIMFQAPIYGLLAIFGILFSQYRHKKDNFVDVAKINIHFMIISSIVFSLLMYFIGEYVVKIFFIKDDYSPVDSQKIQDITTTYIKILALGNIFATLGISMINPLTSLGFAKYSLYSAIGSLITNFGLNFAFIYGLDLGAYGAAWSTTTAYGVEFILAVIFIYIHRKRFFPMNNIFKINTTILKVVLKRFGIYFASAIMVISYTSTSIFITLTYGTKMMKSLSIAYSISGIMFTIMPAIKKVVEVEIGKELGKDNFKVAETKVKKLAPLIFIMSLFFGSISAILALFVPQLTIDDAGYATKAKWMILIFAAGLLAYSFQTYYSAVLESGGKQIMPAIFNYWAPLWIQTSLIIALGPWGANLEFTLMYLIQSLAMYITPIVLYMDYKRKKWLVNLNPQKNKEF